MNVHTCVTDNTAFTMLYVRSICPIYLWNYTQVLLITMITPCGMSDQYARYNYKCTNMCYK
jgi:hypothetical protein